MAFDRAQFADLYPFASHWLELEGGRLHYLDEGSGRPVLIVHGNPTWSFAFRDLVRALAPHHRVIVPDHMGCGLSDKPSDAAYAYRLARRVADLEALVAHTRPGEPLDLIVHDWGGMIALAAFRNRPAALGRLVILNTAAFLLPPGKRLPLGLWLIRNVPWLGALFVRGANGFARGALHLASARGLDPRVAAGLVAPYDSWRARIATLRFVEDIPLAPADPSHALCRETELSLAALADHPALVLWGERDPVFDVEFLAEWRRRWPHAEVHAFTDAGHYVFEDARDEVIARVTAFLDARPA